MLQLTKELPTIEELRKRCHESLATIRNDHRRTLNPTPYKVSLSNNLFTFLHRLWLETQPVGELS
jgi:nicotinate phosphoribosyltransferase